MYKLSPVNECIWISTAGIIHTCVRSVWTLLTLTASRMRMALARSFSLLQALSAESRIFGSGTRSYPIKVFMPVKKGDILNRNIATKSRCLRLSRIQNRILEHLPSHGQAQSPLFSLFLFACPLLKILLSLKSHLLKLNLGLYIYIFFLNKKIKS